MGKMKLLFLLVLSTLSTFTISGQSGKTPTGIAYEKRTDMLNAPRCNPSEAYLKKKVKAQLATYYKDYPYIAVDFTSLKGQNGYSDKEDATRIVYPFKIEMLVYLKRMVIKEGKEHTEITTWKYDAVYEYATKPRKKCEFYLVPSSQTTRIKQEVF
jgi:hypothetical protein